MVEEKILGVIPRATETGFMKAEVYNIVITDRRIIGARLTAELAKEAVKEAGKEAKAAGKGFLKRMWAQTSVGLQVHKRYENMEPEEILREDEKNFAWDYEDIKAIKLKKGGRPVVSIGVDYSGGPPEEKPGEMTVEDISGKKRTFTFDMSYFSKAKDVLKQAAGGKLR